MEMEIAYNVMFKAVTPVLPAMSAKIAPPTTNSPITLVSSVSSKIAPLVTQTIHAKPVRMDTAYKVEVAMLHAPMTAQTASNTTALALAAQADTYSTNTKILVSSATSKAVQIAAPIMYVLIAVPSSP
ncbi:unnamed protein product [Sphagnum balticum]